MQRHCVNNVVTVATARKCINLLKSDAVLHIQDTKGQDPRRFNHLFVSQHWQLCHHDTVKSSAACLSTQTLQVVIVVDKRLGKINS